MIIIITTWRVQNKNLKLTNPTSPGFYPFTDITGKVDSFIAYVTKQENEWHEMHKNFLPFLHNLHTGFQRLLNVFKEFCEQSGRDKGNT